MLSLSYRVLDSLVFRAYRVILHSLKFHVGHLVSSGVLKLEVMHDVAVPIQQ